MSSKPRSGLGDYEFLRAAIECKEYVEREYDVVVTTAISLRRSPCVLLVRLEAKEARAKSADKALCAYEVEWPNAGTYGWPATLFQAYTKLERLVSDSRLDEGFMATSYSL